PATLMGVNGRPTRACALSRDSERPSCCDQPTEPQTPNVTTAATKNARFKLISFIRKSPSIKFIVFQPLSASLIHVKGSTRPTEIDVLMIWRFREFCEVWGGELPFSN